MTSTEWTCSECSTPYPYRDHPPKHGGPKQRGLDRRYGLLYSCWRNKKCPSHKRKLKVGRVTLIAPGAPNPIQPEQDMADIQFGPKRKVAK